MSEPQEIRLAGKTHRVERGRLEVPESREAGGPPVLLAWARLRTSSPHPGPPLVYLAEGPGVPVLRDLERSDRLLRWVPFLETRDVVLFDQRGCGESERNLRWRCPDVPPREFFADPDVALDHVMSMSRRARAELEASGANLAAYHARESARDVAALLDALCCRSVVLAGFSYGAQLAVEFLRRHPGRVERAVLAGTEGPGHALKLPLETDRYLKHASPGLLERFDAAVRRLESDPARVEIVHRTSGDRFNLDVGRFGLAFVVCRELWAAGTRRRLPDFFDGIAAGRDDELGEWLRRHVAVALRIDAMPLLVDGASGASAERLRRIREQIASSRFGNAMNFPLPDVDEVWRPTDLGDAYREEIRCDVPALFLSGEWDWNAPPGQSEELARGFERSRHLCVRRAVHQQVFEDPAVLRAAADFLEDPASIEGRRLEVAAAE